MAGSLVDLQNGLQMVLATVPNLRVADHLPEQVTPPMAMVLLQSVTFHGAMGGGLSDWEFVVSCVAGRMGERSAQMQIDSWLSYDDSQSIRSAIEADMTLGGAASTLVVADAVGIKPLVIGDASYLNVEFTVHVYA